MGADKARQTVAGVPMGVLAGRALLAAARPVIAVGDDPGLGLETVSDDRRGPLAALVAGMRHLLEQGFRGPVLVVACDLPFVTPALLSLLAGRLGGAGAAVPVYEGRLQPLAACYAPAALEIADALAGTGERSMRTLLERIEVHRIDPAEWTRVAAAHALADVDTPAELRAANSIPSEGSG